MKSEIEEITVKAMKLPPTTRAYLAEILLESLDYEEDFPITDEWMTEIHNRSREIDEGKIQLVPAEDAFVGLKQKYS